MTSMTSSTLIDVWGDFLYTPIWEKLDMVVMNIIEPPIPGVKK